MNKALNWVISQESATEDGTAEPVNDKNVEVEQKASDLEQGNLDHDNANEESQEGDVEVSTTVDISVESSIIDDQVGLTIESFGLDEKSNAHKRYVISGYDASSNPAAESTDNKTATVILLQNGVIPEVGRNGVTCEELLKVVEDVFQGFQEGQFACEENEKVLFHVRAAQELILARLNRRKAEGTEGTHTGN